MATQKTFSLYTTESKTTERFLEDPESKECNVFMMVIDNVAILPVEDGPAISEEDRNKLEGALSEFLGVKITLTGIKSLLIGDDLDAIAFVTYTDVVNFIRDFTTLLALHNMIHDDDIRITSYNSLQVQKLFNAVNDKK